MKSRIIKIANHLVNNEADITELQKLIYDYVEEQKKDSPQSLQFFNRIPDNIKIFHVIKYYTRKFNICYIEQDNKPIYFYE